VLAIPKTSTEFEFERCDRCGARAKMRAVFPSGGELYFCGHHARQHASGLQRHWTPVSPVTTDHPN
jgi:hypothetical protein